MKIKLTSKNGVSFLNSSSFRILLLCTCTLVLAIVSSNYFLQKTSFGNQIENSIEGKTGTFYPIIDTYVAKGKESDSFAAERNFRVGYDADDDRLRQRAILQFDLSVIPEENLIISATLTLKQVGSQDVDNSAIINIQYLPDGLPLPLTWKSHLPLLDSASAPVSSQLIDREIGFHSWDIGSLANIWAMEEQRLDVFNLILRQQDETGDTEHEHLFRSVEGTSIVTTDPKPELRIYHVPPPHIAVRLRGFPKNEMPSDGKIRYEINLVAEEHILPNYTLSNVNITETIPSDVELVDGSISPTPKETVTTAPDGYAIVWHFGEINENEEKILSYQVQVPHTPTPPPTPTPNPTPAPSFGNGLIITKTASISDETPLDGIYHVRYDLNVNVASTVQITEATLEITDTVPLNSYFVSAEPPITSTQNITEGMTAELLPPAEDGIITWRWSSEQSLSFPITATFTVATTQTITNSDYGVRTMDADDDSENDYSDTGDPPIVVKINERPTPTPTPIIVTNDGAIASWTYNEERFEEESNAVSTSSIYLPFLAQ